MWTHLSPSFPHNRIFIVIRESVRRCVSHMLKATVLVQLREAQYSYNGQVGQLGGCRSECGGPTRHSRVSPLSIAMTTGRSEGENLYILSIRLVSANCEVNWKGKYRHKIGGQCLTCSESGKSWKQCTRYLRHVLRIPARDMLSIFMHVLETAKQDFYWSKPTRACDPQRKKG